MNRRHATLIRYAYKEMINEKIFVYNFQAGVTRNRSIKILKTLNDENR
jgi:hypothetical protein